MATKAVAVVAGSATDVTPPGATFTLYDLAESLRLGGKSYFNDCGNPIAELGNIEDMLCYIISICLIKINMVNLN